MAKSTRAAGKNARSRGTVSGPAEPPPSPVPDPLADMKAAAAEVSASFTFNPNKAREFGREGASAPDTGASVKAGDPLAGASTVSELNGSEKSGSGGVSPGQNPLARPLDRVRVDSTARALTTELEARFNYEARDTASVWAGVNFSGGESVEWEFTPMLGGVFGVADGVAPGYKGWIGWRALEFYSEGEAMIDLGAASDSFFYNWSEVTLAPVPWFKFGLVTQRTRAYESDREIQRGLILRGVYRNLEVTTYVLNPDDSKPIVVLAFGISF